MKFEILKLSEKSIKGEPLFRLRIDNVVIHDFSNVQAMFELINQAAVALGNLGKSEQNLRICEGG